MIIATLISCPSFFLINNWMQNFVYRINFGMVVFGITLLSMALGIFVVAAATISHEAIKAAKANPAEAFAQ